jgi:uncharacterized protein (DUF952 family)
VTTIYKILRRDEWQAAQQRGSFEGSAVDHRDGYIHFSTAEQARETAEKHFQGQADLVVLEVDVAPLGAALKWEPSRGGALFPHLYGVLSPAHVRAVHDASLDADGIPAMRFLDQR